MRKNILFSILVVLTTFCLVESRLEQSFERTGFFITLPTQKTLQQAKYEELKTTKEAQKEIIRKPAVMEFDREYQDVEELNFYPKVSNQKQAQKKQKIQFVRVKKTNSLVGKAAKVTLEKQMIPENQIKKTKIKIQDYEISYDKISEQKPIQIKPLQVTKISGVNLELLNKKVAISKNQNLLKRKELKKEKVENDNFSEDRISTAIAAIEKSSQERKVVDPSARKNDNVARHDVTEQEHLALKESEELVFFDYSQSSEVQTATQPVGERVNIDPKKSMQLKNANSLATLGAQRTKPEASEKSSKFEEKLRQLNNQTKNQKKSKRIKQDDLKNAPKFAEAKGLPAMKEIKEALSKASALSGTKSFEACNKIKNRNSGYSFDYSIGLKSIGVTNQFPEIRQFEMRFQDDVDQIEQDFGTGRINLVGDVQGDLNIRRGTLLSRGHYPVTIDLALENTKADITIPALTLEKMEELATELGIADLGAHLLVELDKETEDVDLGLDHKYQAKFFLDRNYNIVNRAESDFYFVFFMGVEPGNTIIKFLDIQNRVTSKIVHLSSEEIYYEPNFYFDSESEVISFYEQSPLSECLALLSLSASELSPWAMDKEAKKENLNTFLYENMRYPLGSRKYYKLGHLEEPVFLGRWGQEQVVIPSEAYIEQVLSVFNIKGGECVVQINLTDQPLEVKYNGISDRRGINLGFKALDKDGRFYNELSDQTQRIFIVGEEQGIVNLELIYPDNTKRFIQTYCSENTYLIEQL